MTGNNAQLGQVLKAIRVLARVRPADVAAAARCTESFVDSVERGLAVPSQRTIRAWLRACDATVISRVILSHL